MPSNEFVAERHLYLALVGAAVLFGIGVRRWLTADVKDAAFWRQYSGMFRVHQWRSRHATAGS